jgi:hypothetical protein
MIKDEKEQNDKEFDNSEYDKYEIINQIDIRDKETRELSYVEGQGKLD